MSLNPVVRIKHFVRVLIQISHLRLVIRPLISVYIKCWASRFFDGKYLLEGSFYTKAWIPFVSDVDLKVIGKTLTENQKKIRKQLFYLNQYTRIDITAKFTSPELDHLCHQAGIYYHHASPWLDNKLISKRRNLWLCLREIINRYPEHARSTKNFIYLPSAKHKDRWLEFSKDIGLDHLAKQITTEESLSLWTRLSAKSCEKIFWKNYFLKFQIIQGMPKFNQYFDQTEECHTLIAEVLKVIPISFKNADELQDYYSHSANITPFPEGHPDLYPFLPKVGLTSIKLESPNFPKLAILQWTLETIVIFYDNPYLYEIDPASYSRLVDCIYNRLPLLNKILNHIEIPEKKETVLNDKIIQDHYILAEKLLRQAMQLNNLLS
jgi:hypothetical protein